MSWGLEDALDQVARQIRDFFNNAQAASQQQSDANSTPTPPSDPVLPEPVVYLTPTPETSPKPTGHPTPEPKPSETEPSSGWWKLTAGDPVVDWKTNVEVTGSFVAGPFSVDTKGEVSTSIPLSKSLPINPYLEVQPSASFNTSGELTTLSATLQATGNLANAGASAGITDLQAESALFINFRAGTTELGVQGYAKPELGPGSINMMRQLEEEIKKLYRDGYYSP